LLVEKEPKPRFIADGEGDKTETTRARQAHPPRRLARPIESDLP
jgi:hypothetical protein